MIKTPAAPAKAHALPSVGMAHILRMLFDQADIQPLVDDLSRRLEADPSDAVAVHDMSLLLQGLGQTDQALDVLRGILDHRRDFHVVHGRGTGPHILAFVTAGDFMANTPIDFLLEGSDAVLHLRYVDAATTDLVDLPAHDVAFVAVAESTENQPVLLRLKQLLANWRAPILNNRPEAIANLTRDGVSAMLSAHPRIVAPTTWRADRSLLQQIAADSSRLAELLPDAALPLIVRPVGTHAGGGMEKIEGAAALAAYLAEQPGDRFYVQPFVDYRGADGLFNKQRVVLIDGRPFASHMAMSDHWMVHYLSAGMSGNPDKRAIEARWMATFDEDYAQRHAEAFAALHGMVGLDYFGMDCAELPDGRLLVFELDVAMVVHDMDGEDLYPYKKPAMRRLFDAFLAMVDARREPALAVAV
jgi:hypothetical protein